MKRIGPSQAIKCSEASKLLSALVAFAQDADPNARNDGRRGLFLLNQVRKFFIISCLTPFENNTDFFYFLGANSVRKDNS